ncbi:MAG: hypothetical protein ABSH20_11135 [Tepidisphaeraceae bacterium]|jgi:hypothetical protein
MNTMRSISLGLFVVLAGLGGCAGHDTPDYGVEQPLNLPGYRRQTWAVAPAVNLSGQKAVDPLIQADLLYMQLQQVAGLNVIPVNRVVDVYTALRVDQVKSERQAQVMCELLDCDAIVVATVTAYDPFDPPKMGAALQLFRRGEQRLPPNVDPRDLVRQAAPTTQSVTPPPAGFVQAVGMFDAANGSTRIDLLRYAAGRNDPAGPLRERVYFVEMDKYAGFVYHSLISELLNKPALLDR